MRDLAHVLWIGGAPAAGKTTVASRLARRHGLRLYRADTRTWEHRDRALRTGDPAAVRWEAMTPEERWTRPADELLELSLHAARGPMILEDLRGLPSRPLVVAEGTPLPAAAVDSGRAVWLVPSDALLRSRLAARDLAPGPRRLYELLAQTVERDARQHGLTVLELDGSLGVDETVAAVEAVLADALAAGPHAASPAERRELLREANEAIVAQVRGYYARPWAEGEADDVEREFLCECGDPACVATVTAPVGAAAAGTVLAHTPAVDTAFTDETRPCPICGHTTWIRLEGMSTLQALEGGLEAYAYSCDRCGFIRWHRRDKVESAEPQR